MKTRPILFKAPMVRAVLAGRKNQTRRLVKWPVLTHSDGAKQRLLYECDGVIINHMLAARERHPLRRPKSPYGVAGDGLWVKETHALLPEQLVIYKADGPADEDAHWTWRPSIHMPRWASRITLRVTDVRVERLQDISEEDAWAEGCEPGEADANGRVSPANVPFVGGYDGWDTAREWYADLWDSINGAGAWDANPWVWVVGFERVAP